MDKKKVNLLWTGGYDSTFRLIKLSVLPVTIQPYYITNSRPSASCEESAMRKIQSVLEKRSGTRAEILPVIRVDMHDIKSDGEISDSYNRLLQKDFFGNQYDWLARFALDVGGLELSVHKDDKAIILIEKYGGLKRVCDDITGEYYVLDTEKSDADLTRLFGNFTFPVAAMTKLDMKSEYEKLGCKDIIDMTWFCHFPRKGKPCGTCNPCRYTIEEGMGFRLDFGGLARYRMMMILTPVSHALVSLTRKPRAGTHIKNPLKK